VLTVKDAVDVASEMLVSVVAVVIVTVTTFISGSDTDNDASNSCKPTDAKVVLSAIAVLLISSVMFRVA
jgi:hypothetical protein